MQHPDRFCCRVEEHRDAVHVIASGDLDYRTRNELLSAVQQVLDTRPGAIVLDLTAVPYLSSEGVSALIDAHHRTTDAGHTLTITPGPFLRRRLDAFGLTDVLPLSPNTTPATPPPNQ